nr:uncharacterized protein LOC111415946 isoform X2 [Onthophagus taurus]
MMSSTSREVREYVSTLDDLTCNSKPMINVLTMLAGENVAHASDIVATIESHLDKVPKDIKLPVLYLIDCIMKTVGGIYLSLFSQNIVSTFCQTFEVVDEKTRSEMFKLRQTWNDVLPKTKLYNLDVKVNQHLDPAWPISDPPVTNNIHLNPKFLQNMTLPKKSPPIAIPTSANAPPEVGPSTLDMQKKLLMKQQQLLELQQKRLELEVLQAQVKLQERINMGNGTSSTTDGPKINKAQPEVAKQLSGGTNNSKNSKQLTSSSVMNKRLLPNAGNSGVSNASTPKITPVNSALVAAASSGRTRDPRLARLQSSGGSTATSAPINTTVSSNVPLENKSNINAETLGSNANNNKSLNINKASVQGNSRSDPRSQVSSKGSAPPSAQTKSKTPTTQSLTKKSDKSSDLFSTKAVRAGRSGSKLSSPSKGSSGSASSLDSSPTKNKSGKSESKTGGSRSSSASPNKHKKKEKIPKITSSSVPTSSSSSSSSLNNLGKADKESRTLSPGKSQSDALTTTFKELKPSSKSRNYIRRNRDLSVSPEPVRDVDLRLSGPPEKQARLQCDISEDNGNGTFPKYLIGSTDDLTVTGMDVDLRHLPSMVSKKRSSTDNPDPSLNVSSKKSKTEVFDELFGNEDTDLRQLTSVVNTPSQDRPPTPPPPIISSKPEEEKSEKVKKLDILRAKLANATNREKLRTKQEQKQKDTDLRGGTNSADDSMSRIIISSADEQCIKTGNMTKEQEKALMNKILAQMENQKLNEAKRKDNEENLGNITLQPISDDELEANFSCSSDEDTATFRRNIYVDKDDRVPQVNNNEFNKFPRGPDRGDLRRGMWRGRPVRGRGMIRGGIRLPMRPGENWPRPLNGPWKPMQSNFIKQSPIYNNEVIDLDSLEQEQTTTENSPQELVVDCANQDNTKSINIDGYPRDIRYYDETAIIFMSWDEPKEISFQSGVRKVIFGDKDIYYLSFNEPYKEVLINGSPHNVKLGAPTREIYVDGKNYECFFGGPQVFIDLDGKLTSLKMEGPPPQVKIGTEIRKDLVAGQINLIIDAKTVVPVYLDGKLQKFEIDGKPNTLKFIDALKTVMINDIPFTVEYGGLPKPIIVQEKKHFIRFTRLPRGVHPGVVRIKDMEGFRPDSPKIESENSMEAFPVVDANEPALPVVAKKRKLIGVESPDRNSNSPVPNLFQQTGLNNLDSVLSSVMASNLLANPTNLNISTNGYQVENQPKEIPMQEAPQEIHDVPVNQSTTTTPNPAPLIPTTLNINDLFQKLVATGIMTTLQEQKNVTPEVTIPAPQIINKNINPPLVNSNIVNKLPQIPSPPHKITPVSSFLRKEMPQFYRAVNFDKPETLKTRHSSLVHSLYSGMPCSTCGMRFPPEQSMQYSQHLDWHFRQNRKGKKNIRKAASRRWYYSLSDWKNYEEIEDLEEREKSYFENQQQAQAEGNDEIEEEIEIPSVPADPNIQDPRCEVCHDRFDQFYNEEKEEWHLKLAICVDGLNYHPLCYEDYQASLVDTTLEDSAIEKEDETTQDSTIPGLDTLPEEKMEETTSEIVIDDDESEKLTEISETKDKEEISQEAFPDDPEENDDDDDDDVIINEIVPEKIDLVDDDRYDDLPDEKLEPRVIQIKEEPIDDGFVDVDGAIFKMDIDSVKIKSEPIDPDELEGDDLLLVDGGGVDVAEKITSEPVTDAHPTDLVTHMDGNVEFFDSNVQPTTGISGKIKINITKPLPVIAPKESSTNKELSSEIEKGGESIDPSQPLPPGEEPVQLNVKPALRGINLKKMAPVKKGAELSGLCSIM